MASDRHAETADIKALLQARIEALARDLAPEGSRSGKYWIAKCPWRADRKAGSFWIALRGAPGSWRDEATGDKGDVFRLIERVHGLANFADVATWSRNWLGMGPALDPAAVRQAKARVEHDRARHDMRDAQRLEENRNRAHAMWLKCTAHLEGSPVETYLNGRGIWLAELARLPGCLRWHPCLKHREAGRVFPTMVVLMTGADDKPQAIHRTWIAPDGSGKAAVDPARKIWPSFSGATMRLARGETRLSAADAVRRGQVDKLLICEGVEDGLSLAVACPEYRVWAAGALGNLQHIKLPDCTAEVVVAADNDWGKPQAERLLKRGLEALAAQRRPVKVARSPIGKDVNDALRGSDAAPARDIA